jgi:hypothetical protein
VPIVAAVPGGEFYGWTHGKGAGLPIGTDVAWLDFLTRHAVPVELLRCGKCRGWWFAQTDSSWRCRCCGAYDGARYVSDRLTSPLPSSTVGEDSAIFPDIDLLRAIGSGDPISALL